MSPPIDTTALYEDVSTLDRPAIEALATEAFILAVQHIMAKLNIPDGDLAAHTRWLMGLPPEWDDCAVTAMQSMPSKPRRSSKPR